jgi:hypothetical protein
VRVRRLGIREKSGVNAHFLDLEVARCVRRWRQESPEQWKPGKWDLDGDALREVLHQAESMGIDPCLVAHVVMGVEWLFRERPMTPKEVEAVLDEIEERFRRSGFADSKPWLASLVVGAIAPDVLEGLKRTRYLISLRQWATPKFGWRNLALGQGGGAKQARLGDPSKPGKTTTLSPIIASLVVEGIAERLVPPRGGSRSLALGLASLLKGSKVQAGDYGVWRRATAIAPPVASSGMSELPASSPEATGSWDSDGDPNHEWLVRTFSFPPSDLRDWLVQRWVSSFLIAFIEKKRGWRAYLHEAAHNPLVLFLPVANLEVVSSLYSLSWYHDVSPRRPIPKGRQNPNNDQERAD